LGVGPLALERAVHEGCAFSSKTVLLLNFYNLHRIGQRECDGVKYFSTIIEASIVCFRFLKMVIKRNSVSKKKLKM
jgi:hypothetical protein